MKIWLEPEAVAVPDVVRDLVGGHPLVAETLARRGLTDPAAIRAFLDPDSYSPASPLDLPDMDRAVERLLRALDTGEQICVWGDFDVDGQTSTSLLVSALRTLGANVTYHIPNRQLEGHGVNVRVLAQEIDDGAQVILTCDTGIAAHEAVDYANERGVDVVITDHHQLPANLPDAYAAVNPQRLPAGHPLHTLPGVGCAYKLIEAVYDACGRGEPEFLLDLVALGIVADVATQTGDARYLLQRGLHVLRHTQRAGLRAMMQLADLNAAQLTEEHIGFMLGPRMNALGRLADANDAVELLTTDDSARALELATILERLNVQRKQLTNDIHAGAQSLIERDPALNRDHAALVLANPFWHTGVVGIVASRLVEQYNKPVILLRAPEGDVARGSARSVDGCDITAAIAANRHLLHGFGGHTMAAGLSLDTQHIPEFRAALSHSVRQQIGDTDRPAQVQIAGYVDLNAVTLDLVAQIERLAPFGAGNPPLVLAVRDVAAVKQRAVGADGDHLQLTVADADGHEHRVIWWNGAGMPQPLGRFDMAFVARASDFRGERRVDLEFVDFRLRQTMAEIFAPKYTPVDYRDERAPDIRLKSLLRDEPDLQVWWEGVSTADKNGAVPKAWRTDLEPAAALAIWTTPPSAADLRAVLGQVSPKRVYLFGQPPPLDLPPNQPENAFLRLLGQLLNHLIAHRAGQVSVTELAGRLAQTNRTVEAGLTWLQLHGDIEVRAFDGDSRTLVRGSGESAHADDLDAATGLLRALLDETAAYRRQFRQIENPLAGLD